MTEERRESDREIADLRVIVADHIGRCAELNRVADQRHAENIGRMDRMDGKLDLLIDAQKAGKVVRRMITGGWAVAVALAGCAGWAWDHLR